LTIVGDGDRRASFERMTGEFGLSDAVRFLGQIDDRGLRDAYQNADLLVLPSPSESEGFGLVVLEAYACGCPVVTNRAAGSGEVVAASGCGALWEGDDAGDLAAAIERVLADATPRAEVAAAARSYAQAHHSWQAVGDRLSAALSQAIEDRRAARGALQ
jgi:glycosyltransferase involved in cell wall biosynthesis